MIPLQKHTLPNGLRIVHSEDKSTQMVALHLLYDVGARDEDPNHTGFAHLFEHLMFGGSLHIPDYDHPLQNAAGENNAWTNNDCTNFYVTLPKENVETAFWLESDRMLSLSFQPSSLEVQRQVVIEEFKQRCLNQPYGDISHLIRALCYSVHPYQWPTIGKTIAHIEQATMEEVKDFFFRFYAPNNAVLSITGNISWSDALAYAEKWFGPIEARQVPPRALPQEPIQTAERRQVVHRDVPADMLCMAFPMCGRLSPDFYVFDMLSDLLSNGQSSRLMQHLVREQKLFTSIDAYIVGSNDPGLFQILGRVAPGVAIATAEQAVWRELEQLTVAPPTPYELEKVKNKFESRQIFESLSYLQVGSQLALFELLGDAHWINQEVAHYRAVTLAQLQAVARSTFTRAHSNVLHYLSTPSPLSKPTK